MSPVRKKTISKTVLILLACCLLALASCRRDNVRRSPDDIPVKISLRRSWIRDNTKFKFRDVKVRYEVDDLGELLIVPILFLIETSIEVAVSVAYETTFEVYPESRPEYRQRLYWGRTIVYFPPDTDLENATFLVVVGGDRQGSKTININLNKTRRIRMK